MKAWWQRIRNRWRHRFVPDPRTRGIAELADTGDNDGSFVLRWAAGRSGHLFALLRDTEDPNSPWSLVHTYKGTCAGIHKVFIVDGNLEIVNLTAPETRNG